MFKSSKYQKEISKLMNMKKIKYYNNQERNVQYEKRFLGCFLFNSEEVALAEVSKMCTNTGFEAIIILFNSKKAKKIGLTSKEIRSILAHEAGHFRIPNREYNCLETEYAADNYSVKKFGKINLISAMIKIIESNNNPKVIKELSCRLKKLGILVKES